MSDSIQPGSRVRLTIVKQPTREGAVKTLRRIFARDEAVRSEQNRLDKVYKKNYAPRRRGGRLYGGHLVKHHVVKGTVGESGEINATVDILDDIKSVASFLKIETV